MYTTLVLEAISSVLSVKADSSNAFFDCKVLSKQHALLMYDDGQFVLLDTGSSNGTFVNNVRLSRAGEQSEPTRLYSGDVLRFGSDVQDKARRGAMLQKCVVCTVALFHPGSDEEVTRPPESRLFRPTAAVGASLEDLQAVTQTLQEALLREKTLEERLLKVGRITTTLFLIMLL